MSCNVNKTVNGVGPDTHRVVIDHTGTTATITEDLGNMVTSVAHSTTGAYNIVWNKNNTGTNTLGPGMSGILLGSNVVGHLTLPDEDGCTIVTKLVSTGANFTAGRSEFLVTRG